MGVLPYENLNLLGLNFVANPGFGVDQYCLTVRRTGPEPRRIPRRHADKKRSLTTWASRGLCAASRSSASLTDSR